MSMPERMTAVRFHRPRKVEVETVPVPAPGPGAALLKVIVAGICSTDQKIAARGHFKIPAGSGPRVLGHEIVGEVAAIGSGVRGLSVGDRVTVVPNMGCGRCLECARGDIHLCSEYEAFGITLDGGMAEYMLIPARAIDGGNVIPLPPEVDPSVAALAEPLSCCYNSLTACALAPGESLLVVGAGTMGLLHVALGRAMGAGLIVAVDRNQGRLERACRLGADVVVHVRGEDVDAQIAAAIGRRGADVVIVTAPSAEAQSKAVRWAAPKGRINLFAGLPSTEGPVPLSTNDIHYRQICVLGTTGANIAQFRRSLDLIGSGRLDIDSVVTGRFPLSDALRAFEEGRDRAQAKVHLYPAM